MSKNIALSQNTSRDAGFHKFETQLNNIIIGNNTPYGSATIEQLKHGVEYPNVQSAIDDVYTLSVLPINTVIINDDGISPAGLSQTDTFVFSGIVKDEMKPTGDKSIFDFYGIPVEVLVGDTAEEVASKTKFQIETYISKNIGFSVVQSGASLDILQITYSDYKNHNLKPFTSKNIGVVPSISSPAKHGYGTWTRLGTESKTLSGGTGAITLYYFKREN